MWGVLGTFSPKIARANGSGAYESAIDVQGGKCTRGCLANRLPVTGAGTCERLHVRPCYLIPDHVPGIEVSTFAHRLEGTLVVQKLSCSICNGGRVIEGNEGSATVRQDFGGVPVRRRDDRFSLAHGIRERA